MRHVLILLVIGLAIGCQSPSNKDTSPWDSETPDTTRTDTPDWSNPTEVFTGSANDALIRFEHLNYTRYRLVIALDTTKGNLNTERGYNDDEDATLYILEDPATQGTSWHFVRMTSGDILMLDRNRNVLPDTEFTREK